jgi:AcrR family transcriptional regulator
MKAQRELSAPEEQDRLSKIYATAASIICEKGYDATSLNDIADAVGLTKAGLYHYIKSKEELLFAIMNYAMDKVESAVIAPALAVKEAEGRLRKIIASHVSLITGKGQAMTVLVDEVAGLTPAHRRAITRRKRAYFEFIRNVLKQLKAEKKLQEVDVTVATFSLFGMLLWVSRWYRPDGKLKGEQVADEITKIVFGGIVRPAPSPRRHLRPATFR